MSPVLRRALLAILVAGLCLPWPALAQYPSESIKLIVPYAPGGVPDTIARLLAQKLQDRVGQTVVVENRAGGNGSIAAGVIAAASADGTTLLVVDTTLLSVSPLFVSQLSYDPQKDFVPIAALARTPLFLAVTSDTPIKTLRGFDYAKAHPGELNYGSAGIGSTHHLTMEAMKSALRLDITHVPYRGTSQAVPALLGNHVQVLWASYPNLKAGVEGGRIRLLANNGLGRSPLLPELPPLADIIAGFDMVSVIGVYGRAGTPEPVVRKIAAEAGAIIIRPRRGRPARFGAGPRSLDHHRQALQAQLADRAAVDRHEAGIGKAGVRKAREQPADRDRDGGAAEDVADAMMRADGEREYPLRLAMNVEAQRIGKHGGIVVGRKRRRPHDHALPDRGAADLGVAGGDAREGEVAVAGDAQAFLDGVGDQPGVTDQPRKLIGVGIERIERAAGRAVGRGKRTE
jgi:tripartite-type tricarboxylate transporter receptor subunit TctC